jgi:hypothetical protein
VAGFFFVAFGATFTLDVDLVDHPAPMEARSAMADLLYLVARDRMTMYEHLRATFADARSVQVVLDRRRPRRPSEATPAVAERRHRDVREQLDTIGWTVVAIDGGHPHPGTVATSMF